MRERSPQSSSKKPESDQVPGSFNQAFVQAIWRSRWRTLYLIAGAVLVAAFLVWTTIPESSKQYLLSHIGFAVQGQPRSGNDAQSQSPASAASLASVDRAKLRFGISLGWQIGRLEFVDGSPLREAQAVAPTIKSNIADLLSADGFPRPIAGLGYRDLSRAVLTYYGTNDIQKHAAILVGIAAFRASLVGASKDETHNLAMERLALSALEEIDPRILPRRDEFFHLLLRRQPKNIPEVLEFIDSTVTK